MSDLRVSARATRTTSGLVWHADVSSSEVRAGLTVGAYDAGVTLHVCTHDHPTPNDARTCARSWAEASSLRTDGGDQ